jgi:hypothetical protein
VLVVVGPRVVVVVGGAVVVGIGVVLLVGAPVLVVLLLVFFENPRNFTFAVLAIAAFKPAAWPAIAPPIPLLVNFPMFDFQNSRTPSAQFSVATAGSVQTPSVAHGPVAPFKMLARAIRISRPQTMTPLLATVEPVELRVIITTPG